jgi:O-antigen/teichoic acid export membrane protein
VGARSIRHLSNAGAGDTSANDAAPEPVDSLPFGDRPMSDENRAQGLILRGGASAGLGLVFRLGARLVFMFMAARLFGAAAFGAYSLAVATVELAVAIGGLGMKRYLFKLLEERGERAPGHVLLDAILLVALASILLSGAIALAAAIVPRSLLAEQTATGMLWAAPMVAGQALIDLLGAATRWKHRMRYEVVSRSLVEPYVGTAGAIAAYFAGLHATGLLVGYGAGTLAALAYTAFGMRRCYGSLDVLGYRPRAIQLFVTLRESLMPTATDAAAALFYRLDLYLVGAFLGEAPAGIYAMARQFRTPIRQTRQAFDSLLTPIVAKTLSADGPANTATAIASATRMILAIQLAMVLALIAIGAPILGWFGPEFVGGYVATVVLGTAETIQGAFSITDLLLLYLRARLALLVTLAMSVVNVAAALPLIAAYGIDGAALSVLIAFVAGALLRRILLRTRFAVTTPLLHSGGPLLAGAAAALVAIVGHRYVPPMAPLPLQLTLLAAVLAIYAGAILLWQRATGESLQLTGFRVA